MNQNIRRHILWTLLTAFLLVSGCGIYIDPGLTDVQEDGAETCTDRPIQAINPNTGECEWVNACDAVDWEVCKEEFECEELPTDLCELSSDCEIVENASDCACPADAEDCTCESQAVCVPARNSDECSALNEEECLDAIGCRTIYEAQGRKDDGSLDLIFVACVDSPQEVDPCAAYGALECESHPECTAIYEAAPCDCAQPINAEESSDETEGTDECVCPDIAIFMECVSAEEPVTTCEEITDVDHCEQTQGCHWEDFPVVYEQSDGESSEDCICSDEECTCETLPAEREGQCVEDQIFSCGDFLDVESCESHPECQWFGMGLLPPEEDCECPPDSEDCECPEPPDPGPMGICGDRIDPQPCDGLDMESCFETVGCEWIEAEPIPCDCDPNDSDCICPAMESPGFCQATEFPPETCEEINDQDQCLARPECGWQSDDCVCIPEEEDCDCSTISNGYCYTLEEPMDCQAYPDRETCLEDPNCRWEEIDCACTPDEPCDCEPGGVCLPEEEEPLCSDLYTESLCSSNTSCEWISLTDEICADASLDEIDACVYPDGSSAPDYCCDPNIPAPELGYCQDKSITPTTCSDADVNTCEAIEGCTWIDYCSLDPNSNELCQFCVDSDLCSDLEGDLCLQEPGCDLVDGICQIKTVCPYQEDMNSCTEAGCEWIVPDCICPPEEPNCSCPPAFCRAR